MIPGKPYLGRGRPEMAQCRAKLWLSPVVKTASNFFTKGLSIQAPLSQREGSGYGGWQRHIHRRIPCLAAEAGKLNKAAVSYLTNIAAKCVTMRRAPRGYGFTRRGQSAGCETADLRAIKPAMEFPSMLSSRA